MDLPNNEIVSVVGKNVKFDFRLPPSLAKESVIKELDGINDVNKKEKNFHVVLFNNPKDGEVLQLIESNGLSFINEN